MKKICIIQALMVCAICLHSCVQDNVGNINWYLCIRSNDTLTIEYPAYDYIEGKYGYELLNPVKRQKIDSGYIVTCGDVYLGGDYLWTNKNHYKYRYTERDFTIRRLSNNGEVKAFVLQPHNTPDRYGWIPTDVSQRDSVFEVLIRHYGEDNIKTMSINQDAMHLIYQP